MLHNQSSAVGISTQDHAEPLTRSPATSLDHQRSVQTASFDRKTLSTNRHSTFLERLLLQIVVQRIGCPDIRVELWDGATFGQPVTCCGRIVIRQPRALHRLLWNVVLGFGEGFMNDEIVVDGDLVDVLTAVDLGYLRVRKRRRYQSVFPRKIFGYSLAASKSNVRHHYDIGNDFYRLWLDRQCVYTCAYYPNSEATLEEAQIAKLDHVCRKLRLKTGETVIEAGCGWGALALHMAHRYKVTVKAFNLSHEQIVFARERAVAEQVADRIEFIEDDYRNATGTCDAFVSVGMLEHVGVANYRRLGRLIDRLLKPSGRGLIHCIGRNTARPLDAWTSKYIFPGAYAPSLREMMDLFEEQSFSVLDVENLRPHYARTCAEWLTRFERVKDQVQQMFDEPFVRMWRLYLAGSCAAFRSGDMQLFQVLFARADKNDLPLTRADWYATPINTDAGYGKVPYNGNL